MENTYITYGLVAFITIVLIKMYNNMVVLRNRFKNAYAQIDVQLQRRYDLIPNLVETAKGYMKHEQETLQAVIAARSAAHGAQQAASSNPTDKGAMGALIGAEGMLTGALGKLMVVSSKR